MLFSTLQFFAFLAIMRAAFWLAPLRWRKWVLLAGAGDVQHDGADSTVFLFSVLRPARVETRQSLA